MLKHIIIQVVFLILLVAASAQCQEFNMQSFNGNDKIVSLDDHTDDILKISYLKDTIQFSSNGLINAHVLPGKKFLLVDYMIRAGSGLYAENTIIVSIKDKKLIASLHINSLFHEEFIDYSKPVDTANMVSANTTYKTGLNLTTNSSGSYELDVLIHDVAKYKDEPKRNHDFNTPVILCFDTVHNIFYNKHVTLSAYFTVFDPKTDKESKKYLLGTYPAVKLGSDTYYFIKGAWYERNYGNNLSKYSF